MCIGVDLKLYVDSDFASRDSNRRSVSEEVVMCAEACVSFFFFLGRRKVSLFLLLRQGMLRWPRGSKRSFFLRYIWSLYFRTATLGALYSKRIRWGRFTDLKTRRPRPIRSTSTFVTILFGSVWQTVSSGLSMCRPNNSARIFHLNRCTRGRSKCTEML